MKKFILLLGILSLFGCKESGEKKIETLTKESWPHAYETISQMGDTLFSATPSEALQEKYLEKREAYFNHKNLDNLIWYGRFTAYMGNHREAIAIYTMGLEEFPNNSRLLRHRGHRYITVREFDKAIADLSLAAKLIEGKENMIEEDGMPNEQGIPVSTMHGNIYYHLGLAYYLNRNFPKALEAYKQCLSTSNNADNVVSATHWIYMINRRIGRKASADNYLRNIRTDMNVIENMSYHKACLLYKGELTPQELYNPSTEDNPSSTALKYAVGNWYFYNGNRAKANEIFKEITKGKDWASFGFIAAEMDLTKPFNQEK